VGGEWTTSGDHQMGGKGKTKHQGWALAEKISSHETGDKKKCLKKRDCRDHKKVKGGKGWTQ